jgi:dolichol-phosphate mannosyltransferase
MQNNFAVITPLANEGTDFAPFIDALRQIFDQLGCGVAYLVVDMVSKDNTLELCNQLSERDKRFITIWAPETRNVVQAYMVGFKAAVNGQHEFIIEMDAGLSHDPSAIPCFLKALADGNECAFGSRFMKGGSVTDSSFKRSFISKSGTLLSRLLLGLKLHDATSGYQGFHRSIVEKFINYPLLSKAHFWHPELRYLLRNKRFTEVPIHYHAPSPRVSPKVISNSLEVLMHYFRLRLKGEKPEID